MSKQAAIEQDGVGIQTFLIQRKGKQRIHPVGDGSYDATRKTFRFSTKHYLYHLKVRKGTYIHGNSFPESAEFFA